MKKIITMLCMGVMFISCSKNDDVATTPTVTEEVLATAPVAIAENDNSNLGVYKGVFVGSTGRISIHLKNGNSEIKAILNLDGKTHVFNTTGDAIKGKAIEKLKFVSGEHSFVLDVSADGLTYAITEIMVSGHPKASIDLLKEKSNVLVKCFEGTFEGASKGTFNMIIADTKVKGLARGEAADDDSSRLMGTYDKDKKMVKGYTSDQATFEGVIQEGIITGTWADPDKVGKGTFKGKRTL